MVLSLNDNKLLLPQDTVKASSLSSFDQLIINYDNPRTKVTFTSDIGIKMEIDVKIDQKSDVWIHINFYYKNAKIHYRSLDRGQLIIMINAYREYIIEFAKKRSDTFSWSSLKDPKLLAKVFTKIIKIRKVVQRYSDIRSVNVYTVLVGVLAQHLQQDYILARTTLELDADIITIIPPELLLLNTDQINFLMNLHSANVRLANYLFLYPLTKIFAAIKLIKNMVGILSIPLWIVLSIIIFPKDILSDHIFSIINFINFLGIPALLFKLVPKAIGLVVRSKLT